MLHRIPIEKSMRPTISEDFQNILRAFKRVFTGHDIQVGVKNNKVIKLGYYDTDTRWNRWVWWAEENLENWRRSFKVDNGPLPDFSWDWIKEVKDVT